MFVLVFPSGNQAPCTRDGAHNICSAPENRVSITRKPRGPMGQHVITVTNTEYGDTCDIVCPPSDPIEDFRHYATKGA